MIGLLYIVFFIFLVVICLRLSDRRPPNFPPGPLSLPFLGSLPFASSAAHEQVTRIGKQYGSIYSIAIGSIMGVICSDWKAVKAVFIDQGENFSGRPKHVIFNEIMNMDDIATIEGPIWKERKRFCLYHFKNFGFGKAEMEAYIMEELEKLIKRLKANGPKKIDVTYLFSFPLLNIIWRFIGGKRLAAEDKKMEHFVRDIISLFEDMKGIYVFLPYLRNFPGVKNLYQRLKDSHQKVSRFIEEEVDDHMRTFQEGHNMDLMDAFIAEMRKKDQSKEKAEKFRKEVLVGMCYDFFNAAVDANNHSLTWALLYMATWRDIQQKVQDELDRVIGRDQLPTFPDRNRLIYTEAVLQETMRYSSVAPLGVPHAALVPTKVLGYDIPKDTPVVQNIYGVHFDPELWGDPKVFRPERFILENGELHRPEYLIPFGTGVRMCMGEPVARAEMFLMFTGLMHQFTVSYVTGEIPPTFNSVVGLNVRPEDFGLSFRPR